jgi:RNA polymerase sigma-70 factor (ECF subfamily)
MTEKERISPDHWVAAYADYLYGFALQRLSDPELCKDLVQDTFLSAIKNKAHYKADSSVKTWLTAILKHKISDQYRNKTALTDPIPSAESSCTFFEQNGHWKNRHAPQDWRIDEANPLESEELKAILKSCLDKLPPLWALVINRKYLQEENSTVICKELNVTPSNFWVLIHRAKLSLRACIDKQWLRD